MLAPRCCSTIISGQELTHNHGWGSMSISGPSCPGLLARQVWLPWGRRSERLAWSRKISKWGNDSYECVRGFTKVHPGCICLPECTSKAALMFFHGNASLMSTTLPHPTWMPLIPTKLPQPTLLSVIPRIPKVWQHARVKERSDFGHNDRDLTKNCVPSASTRNGEAV